MTRRAASTSTTSCAAGPYTRGSLVDPSLGSRSHVFHERMGSRQFFFLTPATMDRCGCRPRREWTRAMNSSQRSTRGATEERHRIPCWKSTVVKDEPSPAQMIRDSDDDAGNQHLLHDSWRHLAQQELGGGCRAIDDYGRFVATPSGQDGFDGQDGSAVDSRISAHAHSDDRARARPANHTRRPVLPYSAGSCRSKADRSREATRVLLLFALFSPLGGPCGGRVCSRVALRRPRTTVPDVYDPDSSS